MFGIAGFGAPEEFWRNLVVSEAGIDEFGEDYFRPIVQATIRWMGKQKGQVAGFPVFLLANVIAVAWCCQVG